MQKSFKWNQDRILRNLSYATLFICIIVVIGNLSSVVSNYFYSHRNPLVPRQLFYYASFASSVGALFFAIIGFISYRNLVKKRFKKHLVTLLFGLVILYIINASDIHWLLMQINPFKD
ncbi:hypothetical protein [Winogradskyella tangerina]|uniref:hypothetical protein n=1 Tax=Winogradskyella tangerina TaxID=2023240 RepID=UPI0013003364|nr:hypothetical protein [Winogradskyella tangerina]